MRYSNKVTEEKNYSESAGRSKRNHQGIVQCLGASTCGTASTPKTEEARRATRERHRQHFGECGRTKLGE